MRSVLTVALLTASLVPPVAAQTTHITEDEFVGRMLQHQHDGIEMARLSGGENELG